MFRLSLDLGCTVNELLQRLSSSEITEYMAYYSYINKPPEQPQIDTGDEIAAMKEELN